MRPLMNITVGLPRLVTTLVNSTGAIASERTASPSWPGTHVHAPSAKRTVHSSTPPPGLPVMLQCVVAVTPRARSGRNILGMRRKIASRIRPRLGLAITASTCLSDIPSTMRTNSAGPTAAICSGPAVLKSISDTQASLHVEEPARDHPGRTRGLDVVLPGEGDGEHVHGHLEHALRVGLARVGLECRSLHLDELADVARPVQLALEAAERVAVVHRDRRVPLAHVDAGRERRLVRPDHGVAVHRPLEVAGRPGELRRALRHRVDL